MPDPGGPCVFDLGQDLAFDGTASSDPDGICGDSIVSYEWDFDEDGQFDASSATPGLPIADLADFGFDAPGEFPIALRVTDSFGVSADAETTLSIYDNRPFADIAHGTPICGQQLTLDASGSSHGRPDRSIVSYEWDFGYDGVTFVADATGVTFLPEIDDEVVIALRVTDDNVPAHSAIATVTISCITELNILTASPGLATGLGTPSVDIPGTISVAETGSQTFEISLEGMPVSIEWFVAGIQLNESDLAFVFAPGQDFVAHPNQGRSVEIQAVARDGQGGSVATATWAVVRVADVDRLPPLPTIAITPVLPVTTDDLVLNIVEQLPDPDGDAITHAISWTLVARAGFSGPTLDSVNTSAGNIWRADVHTVTDPYQSLPSQSPNSVSAQVQIANSAPIATPGTVHTGVNAPIDIQLDADDVDNDAITFSAQQPAHGSLIAIDLPNGLLRYTPNANFEGSDSFTFRATDPSGDFTEADIDITVNGWRFTIGANESAGVFPVVIGMRDDATDAFDNGIDEVAPPALDAAQLALELDGSHNAIDFRAPGDSASYLLRVDATQASEDLTLNWDSTLVPPAGLFLREVLQDTARVAPAGISLNMATRSQLVIGAGQNRLFEIIYGTVEYTLTLRKGWNLISVPIEPVDPTPEVVFPGPFGEFGIIGFEGFQFAPVDVIEPGKGYMVIVSDHTSVDLTIRGVLVPDTSLHLNPGWNVVGPIADPSVQTIDPDSVIDVPYGRIWRRVNDRWRATRLLHVGFAHFIYSPPAFHFRGEDE